MKYYRKGLLKGEDVQKMNAGVLEQASKLIMVEKAVLARKGEYNLTGERYRVALKNTGQKWPITKLGNVIEINPSKAALKDLSENLDVSFIPMTDLKSRNAYFRHDQTRKLSEVLKGYTYFAENDILLAKITPCFENGKIGIANSLTNKVGFGSTEFIVIRATKDILPEFIYYFISQPQFVEQGSPHMTGSAGQRRLPFEFVKDYLIPLPSIEVQSEIIAELDNYQKIIEGARQVVENYKPQISFDSSWIEVNLGEIAEIFTGTTPDTNRPNYYVGSYPFVKTSEINNSVIRETSTHISEEAIKDCRLKILPRGTVLMAMYGQGKTRGQVALLDIPASITQNAAAIQPNEKVEARYLYFYLLCQYEYLRGAGIEGHISHLNLELVKNLKIRLPSLELQNQIIVKIEEEQKLVENNERLIEIFEQKIKDKLADIWGSGDTTAEADAKPMNNYIAASEEELKTPQIAQASLFAM